VNVAFVGATRGMGRALARRLAERGDAVFLLGRDSREMDLTARDLEARGAPVPVSQAPAGDRARRSNYLYGASKAGLSVFLDGLDLAYRDRGVGVLCVKPGFVRTAMTDGLPVPPFAGEPDAVAREVAAAMDARRHVVYAPSIWRWIMVVIRTLPRAVLRRVRF
jgi:short-subunit dehydrogenase